MLCQRCQQRPASVHFTKIINNEKREMHLCEKCARGNEHIVYSSSFDFPSPFSINHLISAFLGNEIRHKKKIENNINIPSCSVCGTTYEQFAKNGKLGCANCYVIFKNMLEPIFKRVHGNVYHHGKMPQRTGGEIKVKREINKLKSQLNEAIQKEEYERAAKIRDQINELKEYLKGGA